MHIKVSDIHTRVYAKYVSRTIFICSHKILLFEKKDSAINMRLK